MLARSLCVFALVLAVLSPAWAQAYRPDPALYEAAKKEGEVVYYTTQIVEQILRPMIRSFQTYAPGVQIKYVRADGMQLVVRMTNEARAGRVQADAWCMVDGIGALLQGG